MRGHQSHELLSPQCSEDYSSFTIPLVRLRRPYGQFRIGAWMAEDFRTSTTIT